MATDLNYLKRAILTLALSADERDAPDLGARFYSYDKQSGKFIIRLIDEEDQPIDLSQFAIINMVMAPNRDISKGRTIVPMQAEDPEDGVVSVILPDNIRQFNGTIIAGVVAMNADNIKTHDFGYFRFEMRQSLIDANIENLSDFYVDEFEQLREQIHQIMQDTLDDIDAFKLNINAQLQELQNKINAARIDLDTLIAAINAAKINTTNVFNTSLITTPEFKEIRRSGGQTIDIARWGSVIVNNAGTIAMFKPNTTYHTRYVAELLRLTGGAAANSGHFGLVLYSGKSGYPTVWLTQTLAPADVANMRVGDTVVMEKTFTTPAELHDTNGAYQLLAYGRRDVNGVIDTARFHNIMIQEGTIYTGIQTNPDNTLTRFDEERLVKSILIDPKMTGTNPPTIEGGTGTPTTEVTYSSTGEMRIQNLSTGRARVYWSATQLGLDFAISKQPFNVKMVARVASNGSQIEVGYSGQTGNPTFNITAQMDTYTATIKAEVNTAFCIYLEQGETLVIRELYIYPANTDITSKRIATIEEGLPEVKTMVTGTPDTLTGVDANTLFNSGVWKISNGVNMPPSVGNTYFYLRVINFNVNNCLQVASLRQVTANGVYNPTYIRQCTNGTWYEWRKLTDLFSDGRVDTFSVDFDTLKETGVFVNTSATNSPDGAASTSWYTEVIKYGSSGNYVYQRATRISSIYQNTYERQLFNGTWSPWKLLSSPYIEQILGTTSDANKITTSQTIQLEATATANLPTSGSGVYYYLETIARADNYVLQRATLRGGTMKTYTRQSHNGVWSAWSEDIDSSNNQTVGGLKNFTTRPTVNGAPVATFIETAQLTGTVNWDSFDQPGRWFVGGATNVPNLLSRYGYLEVYAHPGTVAVVQRYTDIDGNSVVRTRKTISGVVTWQAWKVDVLEMGPVPLTFPTGFSHYNTNPSDRFYCAAVRNGNWIELRGAVRNASEITMTGTQEVTVAYVPANYRPAIDSTGRIRQGSGQDIFLLTVQASDGAVVVSRNRVNGYTNIQANSWINIGVNYLAPY